MTRTYYGKYKGTVVNNVDPEFKGRVQVVVPDLAGVVPRTWAAPCVPVAGIQTGAWFLPPVGSGVWVEFEKGDPDFPIWSGGFWGNGGEVPALAQASPPALPGMVLQTQGQTTLVLSDVPAVGIMLKTATGAAIIINEAGITIQNGKGASIVLAGPVVTVNAGALTVT
jgi:uncharacterized protein involved in type VI secretion and phage assembly